MRSRIPFLVIEPAKGEYKNVFGADASQNVKVYGDKPQEDGADAPESLLVQ